MEILKNVIVDLRDDPNSRMLASVTLNLVGGYCVRDLKIIKDGKGRIFLDSPFRPMDFDCPKCGRGTPIAGRHCILCGERLPGSINDRLRDQELKKPHRCIFFPVNSFARAELEAAVFAEFEAQLKARDAARQRLNKALAPARSA